VNRSNTGADRCAEGRAGGGADADVLPDEERRGGVRAGIGERDRGATGAVRGDDHVASVAREDGLGGPEVIGPDGADRDLDGARAGVALAVALAVAPCGDDLLAGGGEPRVRGASLGQVLRRGQLTAAAARDGDTAVGLHPRQQLAAARVGDRGEVDARAPERVDRAEAPVRRAHRREQHDLAHRARAGQQHHQAVDAESPRPPVGGMPCSSAWTKTSS
jgi:hypothetical protein